jgi:glycosyltransferase involved in cell wall biosynthesis
MRILYDHQMFALQRFGGISRIFVELARRLSADPDCDVYWHRGYHIDGYDVSDFRPRLARYLSLDRPPPGLSRWPRERINRHAFRLFSRAIWGGVDVYHPSYFDAHVAHIPKRKRLAVTVYDMILERFPADHARFQATVEGKRQLVEKADVVFVISEHTRADVVELLGVDPARTVLAYPASDMASVTATALPEQVADRPFLLYVGPRSRYKNFQLLQHAFAQSDWLRRELRVVCLGGGAGFLGPEVAFFHQHGLSDSFVHLTGDDRLLKALYQHAEALVWTSRYEGFGIPPLEAMEVGCPVVCCPVSSLPEVVGDAALFFDPDQPEQLTECLTRVVGDPALRANLVERGHARARLFSWQQMADATLAGYRHALA